jgi:uncharacterized protein (TIGR03437 family)
MKIDADGQRLLYNLSIPTIGGVAGTATGLAVDDAGAAYLAGSTGSTRVPEPQYVTGVPVNPFLVKIDPSPDQGDLELSASTGATFLQGGDVTLHFSITNHSSVDASDVVFVSSDDNVEMGGLLHSCAATESGVCDTNSGYARVSFPVIRAGAAAEIQFGVYSNLASHQPVQITGSVYSTLSEMNAANNTATSSAEPNGVPVVIKSSLKGVSSSISADVPYTVTGNATPPVPPTRGGSPGFPSYAEPNTPVTITWQSPAMSDTFGVVSFLQWSDGNTDNPRTFNSGASGFAASGVFQRLFTPYLTAAGVVSAASYAGNGIAPGEIIALFGFNLGKTATAQINNGVFSSSIGDVTATFDGHPAPLIYTGNQQMAAVVPWEIAGQTSTNLVVQYGNGATSLTIPVVPAVPALFTADTSGINQAAALNADLSVNSAANPAKAGSVIVLYGTGEGLVSPVLPDGRLSPSPGAAPQLPVTVTIDGHPAQVFYAAEAPTLVSGVIQINALIPASVQPGSHVPVTWSAGDYKSQAGVTIAVQ